MSEDDIYPLRKRISERVPPSFGFAVTNILSNAHVYEITGACAKRREQLGLVQVAKDGEVVKQIQKISESRSAEELVLNREKRLLEDIGQLQRVWSTLSDIHVELVNKGMSVSETASSLRSIRTLINLYTDHARRNPCSTGEIGAQIRNELRSLEDKVVVGIADKLGVEYANKVSAKLAAAWKTR